MYLLEKIIQALAITTLVPIAIWFIKENIKFAIEVYKHYER